MKLMLQYHHHSLYRIVILFLRYLNSRDILFVRDTQQVYSLSSSLTGLGSSHLTDQERQVSFQGPEECISGSFFIY